MTRASEINTKSYCTANGGPWQPNRLTGALEARDGI